MVQVVKTINMANVALVLILAGYPIEKGENCKNSNNCKPYTIFTVLTILPRVTNPLSNKHPGFEDWHICNTVKG